MVLPEDSPSNGVLLIVMEMGQKRKDYYAVGSWVGL